MAFAKSSYPGMLINPSTGAFVPDVETPPSTSTAAPTSAPDPLDLGVWRNPFSGKHEVNSLMASRELEDRAARAQAPVERPFDPTGLQYDVWSHTWKIKPPAVETPGEAAMVEVSASAVSKARRELAEDVIAAAQTDERLEVPDGITVRWFKPESDYQRTMRLAGRQLQLRAPLPNMHEGDLGACNGDAPEVIWLRSDIEEAGDLAEASAHELFHANTFARLLAGEDVEEDDEDLALAFGREVRRAFEEVEQEVVRRAARRAI